MYSFILLLCLGALRAERFQNPVLDGGDYPDPGVIHHNGVYYSVTTTNNDQPEKYPIHVSTDLQNWSKVGYVFNASNFPAWSRYNGEFWAPEIHKIQERFHIYFTARHVASDSLALGLATADHPAGPYTPQDEPFLVGDGMWVVDSSVINHDNKLIFLWVGAQWIRARNLTADGMGFADDTTLLLFKPSLDWEGVTTEGPWYVFRNGYHYIFYSGNDFCTDTYVLGVARSSVSPVGPYEKLPYPILASDQIFKGPGHGSIVPDVDGEGYVFVHHGWKADHVCGDNYRLMFSTTVFWGQDDWPKNLTIGD